MPASSEGEDGVDGGGEFGGDGDGDGGGEFGGDGGSDDGGGEGGGGGDWCCLLFAGTTPFRPLFFLPVISVVRGLRPCFGVPSVCSSRNTERRSEE